MSWQPGDPIYDEYNNMNNICIGAMMEVKHDHPECWGSAARWTPQEGWTREE